MFKTASASIALLALCNPARSALAAGCASPAEAVRAEDRGACSRS